MLAIIGHGISKRVLLDLINAIINKDVEKRDQTLATMAVVQKMMKKHPGLMRLVKANSLDPQRAKKATQAVCDHYFAKLENFIN
jgi:oligoribonuclease (3'-5' exoribonuclease)